MLRNSGKGWRIMSVITWPVILGSSLNRPNALFERFVFSLWERRYYHVLPLFVRKKKKESFTYFAFPFTYYLCSVLFCTKCTHLKWHLPNLAKAESLATLRRCALIFDRNYLFKICIKYGNCIVVKPECAVQIVVSREINLHNVT